MARRDYVHEIFAREDVEKNRIIAAFAYIIFFLPLLVCPYSAFGRFHANQAAALFVCALGNVFLRMFLSFIPGIASFIFFAAGAACMILVIFGMITALCGRARKLPLIGALRLL